MRTLDGSIKTVLVDDSNTVAELTKTVCSRIGQSAVHVPVCASWYWGWGGTSMCQLVLGLGWYQYVPAGIGVGLVPVCASTKCCHGQCGFTICPGPQAWLTTKSSPSLLMRKPVR